MLRQKNEQKRLNELFQRIGSKWKCSRTEMGDRGRHWKDDKMPTNYCCFASLSFSTIKCGTTPTLKTFWDRKKCMCQRRRLFVFTFFTFSTNERRIICLFVFSTFFYFSAFGRKYFRSGLLKFVPYREESYSDTWM